MSVRHALARLLAIAGGRTRLDPELKSEVRAHLELAEADALARGLSGEEARREARRKFGGIEQMKECIAIAAVFYGSKRSSETFATGWLLCGARPVQRHCCDGAGAGIGGTLAMFSVVDAVLLRPLPFPDAGRIVRL